MPHEEIQIEIKVHLRSRVAGAYTLPFHFSALVHNFNRTSYLIFPLQSQSVSCPYESS